MDHFYRYKFSNIELELLGAVLSTINSSSHGNPNSLCDIWSSELDLPILDDEDTRDVIEIPDNKKPKKIIDPFGFFSYSNAPRFPSVIVINENRIKKRCLKKGNSRSYLRTIVLIHEIGHWVEFCVSFIGKNTPTIWNNFSNNNSRFHELWAQIFTYKCLSDPYLLGKISSSAQGYIEYCRNEMLSLSNGQPQKYQTFKSVLNDENDSLRLIERCSFRNLFKLLEYTRSRKKPIYFREFMSEMQYL